MGTGKSIGMGADAIPEDIDTMEKLDAWWSDEQRKQEEIFSGFVLIGIGMFIGTAVGLLLSLIL